MKRLLLYLPILLAAFLIPVESNDVGELSPVCVVRLGKLGENILIQTDSGNIGIGDTPTSALQNLKDTTPGIVYLDTARYLLVEESALDEVAELKNALKPQVRICLAEGPVLGEETDAFLASKDILPRLEDWEKGAELPVLKVFEKRLILTKKSEKIP